MGAEPHIEWITSFDSAELTDTLLQQSKRCLLDLLGVAASATQTELPAIGRRYVLSQHAGEVPLLFTDGSASATGAALYGGWLIDALDAHDGHVLTKGHSGVAVLPALLSVAHSRNLSGREFLGYLLLGYEIATRAGIALHASACDYHTSGSWNALGATAIAGRVLGLSAAELNHALGIAEFYGPRSQMMRCIEYPTMLKDGSGWGAMAGVASAILAREGFTGAPALTLGRPELTRYWDDLGQHWRITEQYFKRFPVCYWAQPAVEALLSLAEQLPSPASVTSIVVETFHEARCLHVVSPATTEQAQYSLPWALAAALTRGTISVDSVTTDLADVEIHQLAARVVLTENDEFNQKFPAERWARVSLHLANGQILVSDNCQAKGHLQNPLSDRELQNKYQSLAEPVLGTRAQDIQLVVETLDTRPASDLLVLLGALN